MRRDEAARSRRPRRVFAACGSVELSEIILLFSETPRPLSRAVGDAFSIVTGRYDRRAPHKAGKAYDSNDVARTPMSRTSNAPRKPRCVTSGEEGSTAYEAAVRE